MPAQSLHKKHMPSRSQDAIRQHAKKIGVPCFPGYKDITGLRIEQLEVIRYSGQVTFGGIKQTSWVCQCDCGELLSLPIEKIATTKTERARLGRGESRYYGCCESCREKICPVCGDGFPKKHASHICAKPSCIETLKRDWHHNNRTKQALNSMLADADKLQSLIEDNDE